jgi:hypothetical protein
MPDAAAHDPDELELLRRMTGQADVREVDHARSLLDIATRDESAAREAFEITRRPIRLARFRMLPVWLRMPPLIAALVVSSAIIFVLAMLLILVRVGDAVVMFAVICVGYTLGFGIILHLLRDRPDEHDDNRATLRRQALQAAIEARLDAAAKVERLERETVARRDLLEAVINFQSELARLRKRMKKPDAVPPSGKPPPPKPDVEYGGG